MYLRAPFKLQQAAAHQLRDGSSLLTACLCCQSLKSRLTQHLVTSTADEELIQSLDEMLKAMQWRQSLTKEAQEQVQMAEKMMNEASDQPAEQSMPHLLKFNPLILPFFASPSDLSAARCSAGRVQ